MVNKNFFIVIWLFSLLLILFLLVNNENTPTGPTVQETRAEEKSTYDLYNEVTDSSRISAEFNESSTLALETAKTLLKRQKGLMFVEQMGEDEGMIFVFEDEAIRTFHMGNTFISLDMIFLDDDFNVVTIHKNTKVQQSYETYSSTKPAKYVVEVNAGWTDRNDVSENDTLKVLAIF